MRVILTGVLLVALFACGNEYSDKEIEDNLTKQITAAAPGVITTVKDGVVTLQGVCPDESCKHVSQTAAENMAGVQSVVNQIVIKSP